MNTLEKFDAVVIVNHHPKEPSLVKSYTLLLNNTPNLRTQAIRNLFEYLVQVCKLEKERELQEEGFIYQVQFQCTPYEQKDVPTLLEGIKTSLEGYHLKVRIVS